MKSVKMKEPKAHLLGEILSGVLGYPFQSKGQIVPLITEKEA